MAGQTAREKKAAKAKEVKLSKDGMSIDFVQSESIPTSVKKFRQSPEIEGLYRFIHENDLQKEALEILERIIFQRKSKKSEERMAVKMAAKAEKNALKQAANEEKAKQKEVDSHAKKAVVPKVAVKAAKPATVSVPKPIAAAPKPAVKAAKPAAKAAVKIAAKLTAAASAPKPTAKNASKTKPKPALTKKPAAKHPPKSKR